MVIYPICVIEQIGTLVQLHINSFGHGHDTLCWFKAHDKSRVFHVKLTSADIIISGFKDSSEYTFYTMNSKNLVPSTTHTAYFNCDSPRTHLNKLKEYVSSYDDPEYASELVSRISNVLEQQESNITNKNTVKVVLKQKEDDMAGSGTKDDTIEFYVTPVKNSIVTPIEVLQQEWAKVEDPLEYEYSAYAKTYQVLERYYALKHKSINKDHGIDFDVEGLFSPVFKPGYQITSLNVYVKNNEKWCKDRTIYVDQDEISIGYNFEKVYKIRAYVKSEMAYEFIHYQPDEDMYSYLWSLLSQEYDTDNETMDADITFDHEDINMTKEEIKWYKEASKLGATDWIVARPQFSNTSNYIIYFFIPNYELLCAFGKKFYLAAQETDLAFGENFQCLAEIENEYVGIDYASCYLGGNIYLYVVDESLKPVSRVTRFSFDEDLEDYHGKVYQLETKNYNKRLEDVMNVRFPKAVPEMNAYGGVLVSSLNENTESLWRIMLSHMNIDQKEWLSKPKIFFGIMEEYLGNFTLDRSFFLNKVTFYHATGIFTFPQIKGRNYVLVVCSFNRGDSNIEESYFPSFNTSIEIRTTGHDYTIMYAIDKDAYYRSGFIIACREDDYITIYNKDVNVLNDNRLYFNGRIG